MTEIPNHISKEDAANTEIKLKNERVTAALTPKGALLKSLFIDGQEVIYEPREHAPGRGGVQVLGPAPGPTKGQSWENLYPQMPSHGLDRVHEWDVVSQDENSVSFRRFIGPAEFLFAGEIRVNVELMSNGVIISKSITNHEDKPREIGHGFHPYFAVSKNTSYEPSTIDQLLPLEDGEAEIIQPGLAEIKIMRGENTYLVEADPQPEQTVVWTDNQELYECLEPWWAKIGRGTTIGPRESRTFTLTITKHE